MFLAPLGPEALGNHDLKAVVRMPKQWWLLVPSCCDWGESHLLPDLSPSPAKCRKDYMCLLFARLSKDLTKAPGLVGGLGDSGE